MDITVYLPDQLGQRAKDDPVVNLSRMLRDTLTEHYAEEDAVTTTLEGAQEVILDLENDNGRGYKGRMVASRLSDSEDPEVYLTDDHDVVVYEPHKLRLTVVQDPQTDLQDWLKDEDYVEAMNALGLPAIVDLRFR